MTSERYCAKRLRYVADGVPTGALEACELGARPWKCGLPCMQCETRCLASRICMQAQTPLCSSIKRSWACHTYMIQPEVRVPTPGSHLYSKYVPESGQKEGYIRWRYAESEWVVSRGLFDKTGLGRPESKGAARGRLWRFVDRCEKHVAECPPRPQHLFCFDGSVHTSTFRRLGCDWQR